MASSQLSLLAGGDAAIPAAPAPLVPASPPSGNLGPIVITAGDAALLMLTGEATMAMGAGPKEVAINGVGMQGVGPQGVGPQGDLTVCLPGRSPCEGVLAVGGCVGNALLEACATIGGLAREGCASAADWACGALVRCAFPWTGQVAGSAGEARQLKAEGRGGGAVRKGRVGCWPGALHCI